MPYVNIKITKDHVSVEKKEELRHAVKKVMSDVLGDKPQTTVVVIDEVDPNSGRSSTLR